MNKKQNQKVLFLGLVWPEPTSSAAGYRILQLIELFLKRKAEVHFASAAQMGMHTFDLKKMNVHTHSIAVNDAHFADFITELQPNIVVFDRFLTEEYYGWFIREYCPDALTILDTEDLHFVRKAREISYKKQLPLQLDTEDTKRELASILKCDLSLIISKTELKILKKFGIPKKKLVYLPFISDRNTLDAIKEKPSFHERKHFLFVGNFLHNPNYQTVVELKKNYWPLVRKKIPSAELHIYGAYCPPKVKQLHQPKEGLIIKGRAESIDDTMKKYRVLLAPIPYGAGIKGKFFDAMRNQLPSVVSSMGAEGMKPKQWIGMIADSPEVFAENAYELYTNASVWNEQVAKIPQVFEALFLNEKHTQSFFDRMEKIGRNLQKYRLRYYTGSILFHQQFLASKYMNLWIQMKNQLASSNHPKT